MLDAFVVLYLFLGGCGAGSLLTAALWAFTFRSTRTRSLRQSRFFCLLCRVLYGVSFAVLVLSALCLLMDLGHPEKAVLLFLRPTGSLLSVGSYVLAGSLTAAALLWGFSLRGVCERRDWRCRAAEAVGAVLSIAMLFYTGLYLAWMPAVPLWHNGALPFLLAFSSLSSGMALVLLASRLLQVEKVLPGWLGALHRLHFWTLVATLLCFAVFLVLAALDPLARPSLAALLEPSGMGAWLLAGFAGAGLAVPLVAEGMRPRLGLDPPLLAGEVLCLLGGLILRFCVVSAGSHWLG